MALSNEIFYCDYNVIITWYVIHTGRPSRAMYTPSSILLVELSSTTLISLHCRARSFRANSIFAAIGFNLSNLIKLLGQLNELLVFRRKKALIIRLIVRKRRNINSHETYIRTNLVTAKRSTST